MILKSLLKSMALYLGVASLIIVTSCNKDDNPPMPEFVDFNNAKISAGQEVPLTNSSATGSFTVKYDKTSNKLDYTINYSGLTPTAMHFHKGGVGVAGGVEQEVKGPYSSGMTGSITLTEAQEVDLLANNWYLNIHTAAFPGGEIRGQVVPENIAVPEFVEFKNASISSAQEVPLNNSLASGSFTVKYDKTVNKLDYTIMFSGLTPTAMHFHKGSVGVAGGVELAVAGPYTSGMTGSLTLTEAQEVDLLANNWYLNIHTATFPGGEIRGQVVKENSVVFSNITLSGKEELPTNSSTATGVFHGLYDKTTKILAYTVSITGITPSAMHLHLATVGVNGAVVFTITGTSGTTAAFTAAQEADLLAGNFYFNAHTAAFPGGEVRGQVVTDKMAIFSNDINGANENPAVTTAATGSFYGAYDKATKKLSYVITYTGVTATAMHFHKAAAGTNGAVVSAIASPYSSGMAGSVTLTDAQETDVLSGLWYVNIHSTANPGGEIRGQLIK